MSATEPGGPCASRSLVTHSYAAIAFYTSGTAEIEQGGRWRIERGDCVVVPAGLAHRRTHQHESSYWGAAVSGASLAACDAEGALALIERVRDGGSPVIHVREARRPFVESLFRELAEGEGSRDNEPVQKSLLTLLVHELDRGEPRSLAAAERDPSEGVVARALRFIERNCLRKLSLDEVALAVDRSPAHLTTRVQRATGRSVGGWILAGRMAEARRRLARTDQSVHAIAQSVGYADPTHFIRLFKREHGASPAQWRARVSDRRA